MRKQETIQVPASYARDAGKYFQITEWPAAHADKWATRAILAYNRGGGDLPDAQLLLGRGMEAIFFIGVQTFLRGQIKAEEVIPILDELLDCVKIIRDPRAIDRDTGKPVATDIVSDDDIEEIKTRWWLRSEVLRVHTNFSAAEHLSGWLAEVMKPRQDSSIIPTSPPKQDS